MEYRKSTLVLALGLLLPAGWIDADDWPQWRGPHRDGVWRETGIVETLPPKFSYKWRTPLGGGYAGPAVAGGHVFVTDRILAKGDSNPEDPFSRKAVHGGERVICLDAETGKPRWEHKYACKYELSYPAGPRATPTIHAGKVYSVGAMGHFFCLDAESGKVLWSKNYSDDYGMEINTWGMAAAPLIDGKKVILLVGGKNNACVVAFDKDSGDEVWRALEVADPGYAPPVIFTAGGARQLVVWTPVHLSSLNPESGKLYWQEPFASNAGLSIAAPIFDPLRNLLFVTSFYNGPLMMQFDRDKPTAGLSWKGKSTSEIKTDGLHAIMCTPVFDEEFIYGVCSYGQLRCLEAKTGRRVWETLEATGEGRWWHAFLIRHEDRYFIHNEQGDLIIAKLSPQGYKELSRAFLIAPTNKALRRKVVWSHPAFAYGRVYARNDEEIVCVDLKKETKK